MTNKKREKSKLLFSRLGVCVRVEEGPRSYSVLAAITGVGPVCATTGRLMPAA